MRQAYDSIKKEEVLLIHPDWIFQKGTSNHRGPYYRALKEILNVDNELQELHIHKKGFVRIAKYSEHFVYTKDVTPSEAFFTKLKERNIDIFTFVERDWCSPLTSVSSKWQKTEDNIALLEISTYAQWLEKIGKKTRNMVRKAEKSGIKVDIVEPSDKLADGIWRIYNETPIRQGRAFSHYGWSLQNVKDMVFLTKDCTFIAAYLDEELVGFIELVYGDNLVVVSQILSLQKHWDKAVNNCLLAKAVEFCAKNGHVWLMYGRIGNHPSLDKFKESNSFVKHKLNRYYVMLTSKGKIAAKLGLHRDFKDSLPESLKPAFAASYNFVSRMKMKLRHRG
jgi:hypothetical protein